MNRSQEARAGLLPEHGALQHEHAPRAPRPLPLFLALINEVAESDPQLARDALAGLRAYEQAERRQRPAPRPEIARSRGACLRDHGGEGPAAVLIPSLINPPHVLDLDPDVSLADAIAGMGRRCLLLDWGPAAQRSELSVGGHFEELLLPLLRNVGQPAALIGYCLGGTMALAAASLVPAQAVITLAAPWHFSAYPADAQEGLSRIWDQARPGAEALGALPMEVLQAAFWSLDPQRTVRKFADFGKLEPGSAQTRRFVELEDWANEGEPLPYPAARELLEDLFAADLPGAGRWTVGGRAILEKPPAPTLHLTAERDRIVPAATSATGEVVGIPSGHVGMIVGSARTRVHQEVARFLGSACR